MMGKENLYISLLFLGVFLAGFFLAFIILTIYYRKTNHFPVDEFENIKEENKELRIKSSVSFEQLEHFKKENEVLNEKNEKLLKETTEKSKENEFFKKENDQSKQDLDNLYKKFSEEFDNIANKALIKNSNQLNEKAQKILENVLEPLQKKIGSFDEDTRRNINEILIPFRQNIEIFNQRIDKVRKEQIQETTSLKTQIESLEKLNRDMTLETQKLTKALKGDHKVQGNWGEVILASILEKSGLQKNEQYLIQHSFKTEKGERIIPDIVIKLPENRIVIIDAKVSLKDYENYCNEENEMKKNIFLKQHTEALSRHIKSLSEKEYQTKISEIEQDIYRTPDFVLMFLPIEPSYSVAVLKNKYLFQEALEKNIVIVTPSTLLMTLRIIWTIWRQEKQEQNVQKIATEGGKLYDKFVNFLEDFQKIGDTLKKAIRTYEDTHSKLSSGPGNLVKKAEDLKNLGIKNKKIIPDSLVQKANKNLIIDKKQQFF